MARSKATAPFTGPQIKISGQAGEILSRCSRLMDVPRNELASRWILESGKTEHARLYNLLLTGTKDGYVDPESNAPVPDYQTAPQLYDAESQA